MKININLESLAAGKVQTQNANTNPKDINKTEIISDKSIETPQNFSKNRTLVDAVIINQIAQDFFQKAVIISSKLKSIATDAITYGKIKEPELNDTLKDISALNNIQEGFSTVVRAQNSTNMNRIGVITETPQINEVNSLKEFANTISSGNVEVKMIDRINEDLTKKASDVDNLYNQLISQLPDAGRGSSAVKFPELAQGTAGQITEYPQAALKSQGNINIDIVKNLL